MPTLAKKWFKENGEFPLDAVGKLLIAGFGQPVARTLVNLDWDGNMVASVGLALTPDNRHVRLSQFLLRGPVTREVIELRANNIWPAAAPDIQLTLTLPDCSEFRFDSGTLASEYIAGEDFRHHFSRSGNVIPPTEWPANGIGEPSIRAICHLDKSSNARGPNIKVTILIYPRNTDELAELSSSTQSAAWPGLRIIETSCPLFPQLPEWKEPCCPLILPGSNYNDAPNFPSGPEIRYHVAALMRTARRPTACTKQKTLEKQWAKATTDIESMELEPLIVWPDVQRHTPPSGKIFSSLV